MVNPATRSRAAKRMLDDLDLNRRWLADERKFHIKSMLRTLKDVEKFHRKGYKDVAQTLGRTLLSDINDPARAYSAALTQCFLRAWKSACPGVKV